MPQRFDSFSGSSALALQDGYINFLPPAFLVKDDEISILSLARFQNPAKAAFHQFTLISKINETAAKLYASPAIVDSDEDLHYESEFMERVAAKFVEFLHSKVGGSLEQLLENLQCQRNPRVPEEMLCFEPLERSKREEPHEPQVSAQLLHQVFQKVKLATENISDNVDFFADDPKEFFVNMDEKLDDKLAEFANKWEEASFQYSSEPVVGYENNNEITEATCEEAEEVDSGYSGFRGLQIDKRRCL